MKRRMKLFLTEYFTQNHSISQVNMTKIKISFFISHIAEVEKAMTYFISGSFSEFTDAIINICTIYIYTLNIVKAISTRVFYKYFSDTSGRSMSYT